MSKLEDLEIVLKARSDELKNILRILTRKAEIEESGDELENNVDYYVECVGKGMWIKEE